MRVISKPRGCNCLKGTTVGQGIVPVAQCLAILKRAGFDGFVDVEFEGTEDCATALSEGLAFLRTII